MKKEKVFLALLTATLATPATLSVTNPIIPILAVENEKINLGDANLILIPATIPYTGNTITSLPKVEISNLDILTSGGKTLNSSDYTVKWENSAPKEVGFYKVHIEAVANSKNCTGSSPQASMAISKRDLSTVDIELTGISSFDSKNPDKAPTISKITDKNSKEALNLIPDKDYTLSYTLILENGDEKAPNELNGAVPKKGKVTITAKGDNCLPKSTTSKEFSFNSEGNNSSTNTDSTSSTSVSTGTTNSRPTLTLPTDVIKVEYEGTLNREDTKKLENYINKNQNEYGYNFKINKATVTNKNGKSTFIMAVRATLNDESLIDITFSNLRKSRSEDAMVDETEFVEFTDLEDLEEMEDSYLDYVWVSDPGEDGKKVIIEGIKASDAFRVNDYLNNTKIKKILTDAGYKVNHLIFSSEAKKNHEFVITNLNKPISIEASSIIESITPSTPVGGSGTTLSPSTPSTPSTPKPSVVKKTIYRFFNTLTGEHFYTSSEAERNQLMTDSRWRNEGQGWIAPESSNYPIYRLCNPNTGEHHYTMDKNEYDTLPAYGWKQEGVGFYSANPSDKDAVSLYRLYNPNANDAGSHHYTSDQMEKNILLVQGWKNEGIAWYGLQ